MTTNGYDRAKKMLFNGWQCIPLDGNKRPLLKFKDIPIDANFIDGHRETYTNCQALALLCRGVWCIDIDVDHQNGANGYDSLSDIPFYDELNSNSARTLIQETPTGGAHLIFKKRAGVAYTQKIDYLKGVDIKAHDNNYFVLAGSTTKKGRYKLVNKHRPKLYDGEFETRIFGSRGNFETQALEKYKIKTLLPSFDYSHLGNGQGGLGKQAYDRIINGLSENRNNDLYLAVGYCQACNVDIEPLRVLIGTVKGSDEFTEDEFNNTVNSALGV